jgi:O-antigen/teichoic acid export membrane protein
VKPRVASWFRDASVGKVVKGGLTVSVGRAFGQLASLISVAVLARQLGPDQFGVLAIIRTVASVTDAYANFNTWQAVIRYGAAAMAAGNPGDVERVIKLSMLIDVATAAVAAVVIAGIALLIPSAFGWSTHEAMLCAAYAVTVLTRTAGTCDGIYRLCNAYRPQAIGDTLQAATPMLAVVIAALLHCGLDGVVIALICGEVCGNAIDIGFSFYIAAKNGYGKWRHAPMAGVRARFPGILHFILATNGQLTVKKTQNELDMIVVAAVLDRAAAGLFKLVKQLGKIPGLVFMPFEQVLFAELARFAAANDYGGFRRLLRRFTTVVFLGSLGVWAVCSLLAAPLVEVIAGEQFLAVVPALRIYLLAMALLIVNVPTQRALIALGRPGTVLAFDLATLAGLLAMAIAGAYLYGIRGVAGAMLVYRLIQLAWSTMLAERVIGQQAGLNAPTTVDH